MVENQNLRLTGRIKQTREDGGVMSEEASTKKISMTITVATERWLQNTYPDAASTQEAIRMAISDARIMQDGLELSIED